MRKKIRFFKQHTMETCGAACLLMLLDYYRKVEYPTPKQETKLYSLYRSRAFKGMNAPSLANCLTRNALQVSLVHSSPIMMENRDDYYDQELYEALLAEYRADAAKCTDRVRLTTGAEITCDDYRRELDAGKLLLVQCIVPGNADGIHDHTLHWVVVYGYEEGAFLVCDPLSSKLRIPQKAMETYMDTPIGRICIVVGQENNG